MRTIHVEIRGLVQGVGFRWFVVQCARRWNVQGWVRNQPDGGVEVAASGAPEDVERFLSAIEKGPPGSRVDAVMHLPTENVGPFGSFHILR